MSNIMHEGQVMTEDEYFARQKLKNPPNCGSSIQKPSPPAPSKKKLS